jgi:hypothetical protein
LRRAITGNLIAASVHALRIGDIVAALQTVLCFLRPAGADDRAASGTNARTYSGSASAADGPAKRSADGGADNCGTDGARVGLVRLTSCLIVGPAQALGVVLLENLKRLIGSRKHLHHRPKRLLRACAKRQRRTGNSDPNPVTHPDITSRHASTFRKIVPMGT